MTGCLQRAADTINISYAYPVSNKFTEIYRPLLVKTLLCWPCD